MQKTHKAMQLGLTDNPIGKASEVPLKGTAPFPPMQKMHNPHSPTQAPVVEGNG
jgi:hypothetical protein